MAQNTKSFIRGTQIFFYNMSMFFQSLKRLWKWGLLIFLMLFILYMYFLTTRQDMNTLCMQIYASVLTLLGFGTKIVASDPARNLYLHAAQVYHSSSDWQYFWAALHRISNHLYMALLYALITDVIIMVLFVAKFINRGKKNSKDSFVSGTRLAKSVKETIKSVKKDKLGISDIKLCNLIPMPKLSERQGIFTQGSIGTGKSQHIMYLLDQIKKAGDIAIVYDKECTLKPYYFDKSVDKELNPLSVTCENWDIWKECRNPIEMGNLATYLMPKAVQGSDPFWVDAARTIFSTVAWKMKDHDDRSAIKLLQVLLTTSLDELRGILKGTEAENLVSRDIEKTAISIRAVLATYTKALRFLHGLNEDQSKSSFAIRDWLDHELNKGSQEKKGGCISAHVLIFIQRLSH